MARCEQVRACKRLHDRDWSGGSIYYSCESRTDECCFPRRNRPKDSQSRCVFGQWDECDGSGSTALHLLQSVSLLNPSAQTLRPSFSLFSLSTTEVMVGHVLWAPFIFLFCFPAAAAMPTQPIITIIADWLHILSGVEYTYACFGMYSFWFSNRNDFNSFS